MKPRPFSPLRYVSGYPQSTLDQVQRLIDDDRLGSYLQKRYPDRHEIKTDKALYDYVSELKQTYLRNAPPLSKVLYQNKLDVIQNALGLHTAISRVQGGKLKAKKEIRIASTFKDCAPEFLEMIVVHELAHFRESDHNKAFYQLCCHMLPDYHQIEFDLRLYLTYRSLTDSSTRHDV